MQIKYVLVMLTSSSLVTSCADDATKSGFPADKLYQELTPVEQRELCVAFRPTADVIKGASAMVCYALNTLAGTCDTTAFDACMATQQTKEISCDDSLHESSRVTDCKATVSEVEACYNSIFAKFADAKSISCQTTPDAFKAFDVNPAKLCAEAYAKCPALFDKLDS